MRKWNNVIQDLEGKVCVITGGAGLIGSTIAIELVQLGVKVAIMDYSKEHCDNCADLILKKTNKQVVCVVVDVLDKKKLQHGKQKINKELGEVDILINCAGGNAPEATTQAEFLTPENLKDLKSSFFGIDIEGFRSVFDTEHRLFRWNRPHIQSPLYLLAEIQEHATFITIDFFAHIPPAFID